VEFANYQKNIRATSAARVQVWDIGGTYPQFEPTYIRGVSAILLVYDVTNRRSFQSCTERIKLLRTNRYYLRTAILVGNKADSSEQRQVSYNEGHAFARHHGIFFVETSAKTAKNIDLLFTILACNSCLSESHFKFE